MMTTDDHPFPPTRNRFSGREGMNIRHLIKIWLLLPSLFYFTYFSEAFSGRGTSKPPHPPSQNQDQHLYYASCANGLTSALSIELSNVGANRIEEGRRGCSFWGTEEVGYKALIWSRVANGIWELMTRRRGVENSNHLYEMTYSIPWDQAMNVDQTLGVQCIVADGVEQGLSHTHYSSLTIKNAIVDQFREAYGQRPSVDSENPDLPLILFLQRDEAWLYRSLSGLRSMHKRGYRDAMHVAALRETLAAAMLIMSGYDPESHVLCDPMCGSGTIAIEAAMKARRMAPGIMRLKKERGLGALVPARWRDTNLELLREVVLAAKNEELSQSPRPILTNDWHPGALSLADKDAQTAGVSNSIIVSNLNIEDYSPKYKPDIVISNPPWDLRLSGGAEENWDALGRFLKREAGGAEAWLLSGNPSVTKKLKMKVDKKIPIEQGGVDLRLLKYRILKAKPPSAAEREGEQDDSRADDGGTKKRSSSGGAAGGSASGSTRRDVFSNAATSGLGGLLLGLSTTWGGHSVNRAQASTSSSSFSKTEQLKEDYDMYAAKYDTLDGGPSMKWLGLEEARAELLQKANGRVLEVAVGTGLNLPHYQPILSSIKSIDAIDLSPGMIKEATAKAKASGLEKDQLIKFQQMNVESLAFEESSFDTVVDTFSLCVFPDPLAALREITRVVKPSTGRVLLLENSRSEIGPLGAYQDLTAQSISTIGGKGCVYNQNVRQLVKQAGLDIIESKSIASGLFTFIVAAKK